MPSLEKLLIQQIEFLQAPKEKKDEQSIKLLFPNPNGCYQLQSTVRKRFIKLQKEANILEIKNIHSLRHTFVINALNSGVNVQNLCGIIGHSNGATTLKFYAHYLRTEAYKQLLELDKFHEHLFK